MCIPKVINATHFYGHHVKKSGSETNSYYAGFIRNITSVICAAKCKFSIKSEGGGKIFGCVVHDDKEN